MKKFAASMALVLAALSSAGAAAQSVPAGDPAVFDATNKLLASMDYRGMMRQMLGLATQNAEATAGRILDAALQKNTRLNASEKAKAKAAMSAKLPALTEAMRKVFADPRLIDDMQALTAQIYARHYTLAEIEELAAFYRSPLGAKMLRTMPKVTAESMAAAQQIMEPRLEALMQDLMIIAEE